MRTILVTGSQGFLGRNLVAAMRASRPDLAVLEYDLGNPPQDLGAFVRTADFVVHLAGVNRPSDVAEYATGNADWTRTLLDAVESTGRRIPVLLSSSIQAALENPYGISKRSAEEAVRDYGRRTGAEVFVYRFPNVFGKWCRPNYNSVVATFCHNVARGLPIVVNDPSIQLTLVYVDDVVAEILAAADGKANRTDGFCEVAVTYIITLGELADLLGSFREGRTNRSLPDLSAPLVRKLHATYLSFLPTDGFSYPLSMNVDPRGSFTEFLRTPDRGQVSINVAKPGIVKGNHWHHTKVEKFLVVSGRASIRFRLVGGTDVLEYNVSGEKLEVVDIPAGYTHSIRNTGDVDLVTVMWASEPFDPEHPDTYILEV